MMKRGLLAYLTPIVAVGLASIAGYISIMGMSKLFAGHALIVMIVMGFIESGKVIGASLLHKHWKDVGYKTLRWLILPMVIVAMVITSWGVYGFFTDAYQKTASQLSIQETEVQLIENKKSVITKNIDNLESQIEFKNEQSAKLLEVRTQQEKRLETYSEQEGWAAYNNAKRTQKQIDEANGNLMKVQEDINTMYSDINLLNDSIGKLDLEILDKQSNNEAASELGPLTYIAKVFNTTMDKVINIVMVTIMFVFDPFAMVFIIATNKMWARKEEEVITPTIKQVEPLQEPTISVQPLKEKVEIEEVEKDDPSLIEEVNPEDEYVETKITPKEEPKIEIVPEETKITPKEEPYPFKEKSDDEYKSPLIAGTPGEELSKTWQRVLRNRKKKKRGNNGKNGIVRLGD